MRIIIKNSSSAAETILCDGPARGVDRNLGPINLQFAAPVTAQVAGALRATAVQVHNRKNQRTIISFSIVRRFTSRRAAWYWQITHGRDCVREDTLLLYPTDDSGAATKITVSNCVLSTLTIQNQGVTLKIDYQLTGGAVT